MLLLLFCMLYLCQFSQHRYKNNQIYIKIGWYLKSRREMPTNNLEQQIKKVKKAEDINQQVKNCHVQKKIQNLYSLKNMSTIEFIANLQSKSTGTITDFKYSPTGQYLAIADSQGFVHIYSKKDNKSFAKLSQFRADQGSVWSIAWADSKYGNLIGFGSFRNKVGIFQQTNNVWKEIAYHDLHNSSVNWVEFSQFGLKLYAGSSDSQVSILQLYHKGWRSQSFSVGDSAIATFALQQFPLGESIGEQQGQKIYPRIATVTKDQKIKIWVHQCQKLYNTNSQFLDQKQKTNKLGYILARQYNTPKQTIRNILWRPSWGSLQHELNQVSLVTCSEEGFLKTLSLGINSTQNDNVRVLLEGQSQIIRISQSLTGKMLSVSLSNKNIQQTIIYEEIDEDEWRIVKKAKN